MPKFEVTLEDGSRFEIETGGAVKEPKQTVSGDLLKKPVPFLQALGTPGRGIAGLAVGAKTGSLERAAAATQPGFVPRKGEGLAAGIGKFVGDLPVSIAAGGAGAGLAKGAARLGIPLAKRGFTQLLSGGAAVGATASAVEQADKQSGINLKQISIDAGIGAALGGLPVIAKLKNTVTKALPRLFKATGGIPIKATEQILKEADVLLKAQGTPIAMEEATRAVQKALVQSRGAVSQRINKFKVSLGLDEPFEKGIQRIASGQAKRATPEQAGQMFLEVTNKKFTNAPDKIKALLKVRRAIDDNVRYRNLDINPISSEQDAFLKQARGKINEVLDGIPQGKRLRQLDEAYHNVMNIYGDLEKRLATEGKAEAAIEALFKSDNPRHKDFLNALTKLEKASGKDLINPLYRELTKKAFDPLIPQGSIPTLGLGAGLGGALFANPLLLIPAVALTSPKVIGAGLTVGSALSKKVVRPLLQQFGSKSRTILQRGGTAELIRRRQENQ